MITVIGRQGVLLTNRESQCYDVAQRQRRLALKRRIVGLHRIFWPAIMDNVGWSAQWWRLGLQALLLLALWPLLTFWGLISYLARLIQFPYHYWQTMRVPAALKAPGEKTLIGIHNAFGSVLEMDEADYIECLDRWVECLFGPEIAKEKRLSLYLAKLSGERKDIDYRTGAVAKGLRSNLSVAREYLSKDLGHYLVANRGEVDPQQRSLAS